MKICILAFLTLFAACGGNAGAEVFDAHPSDAWVDDAAAPPDASPPDATVMYCPHKTRGVLIGDSIVQNLFLNARNVLQANGSLVLKIAVAGAKIEDQYYTWTMSPLHSDPNIDWFYVQCGINNILGTGQTVEQDAHVMQVLLEDLHQTHPNAKIYFATMDPARGMLINVPGPERYPMWQDLNALFIAMGANDTISQGLNDGMDNLASNYNNGDGLHPNPAGDLASAAILQSWIIEDFPDIPCEE